MNCKCKKTRQNTKVGEIRHVFRCFFILWLLKTKKCILLYLLKCLDGTESGVIINFFGRFQPNISRIALFPLYFAFIGPEFSFFELLPIAKNWFLCWKLKFCVDHESDVNFRIPDIFVGFRVEFWVKKLEFQKSSSRSKICRASNFYIHFFWKPISWRTRRNKN